MPEDDEDKGDEVEGEEADMDATREADLAPAGAPAHENETDSVRAGDGRGEAGSTRQCPLSYFRMIMIIRNGAFTLSWDWERMRVARERRC